MDSIIRRVYSNDGVYCDFSKACELCNKSLDSPNQLLLLYDVKSVIHVHCMLMFSHLHWTIKPYISNAMQVTADI